MSLKTEGCSCARCKAYLFTEDDVVYCPECGAPHHRDCYSALGHCALEQLHGTPEQYSKEKEEEARQRLAEKEKEARRATAAEETTVCKMCGEKYDTALRRCPKCGKPDITGIEGYAEFDFLGGVPADYEIEKEITADDVKRFVSSNTHRYIPKFVSLNSHNKLSWNWMAFLFPCGWMLSRKMYKGGIIAGILEIISSLLSYPLSLAVYNSGVTEARTYPEMVAGMLEALPEIGAGILIFAALSFFLDIGIRVVFALLGDYFYKNYTLLAIKKIRLESEDMEEDYRKKGGASLLLFFVGAMLTYYLPSVLMSLI